MEAIAKNEFRVADIAGIGRVSLDDFRRYFNQLLHSRAHELRKERLDEAKRVTYPPGYRKHEALRTIFADFSAFGAGHGRNRVKSSTSLDRGQWAKLCRDAKFVAPWGPLPAGSVEIIFNRAKAGKETKGLSYRDFLRALAMVAQETTVPFEEVVEVRLDVIGGGRGREKFSLCCGHDLFHGCLRMRLFPIPLFASPAHAYLDCCVDCPSPWLDSLLSLRSSHLQIPTPCVKRPHPLPRPPPRCFVRAGAGS